MLKVFSQNIGGWPMEKLNAEEYKLILELITKEKEAIHKEAIHNKDLRAREIDLDFTKIKLEVQLKQLKDI